MNKKSLIKVLSLACFGLVLTGCNDKIINYPTNGDDPVVEVGSDEKGDVTNNDYNHIYDDIVSKTDKSARQLDNLLLDLAKDKYLTGDFAIDEVDMQKRVEEKMMEFARSESYTTDYVFEEYRFALYLINQRYVIKTADGKTDFESIKKASFTGIVTPEDEYADVFHLDYSDYIERGIKPDIYRQYLYARYIYDESYASIGTTNAREATAVKITDRSDKKGEATKLIDAFFKEYVFNKAATPEQADLKHLTTLWKTSTDKMSEEDQAFMAKYNISNLADKIDDEVAKITSNPYTTDTALESEYTGGYTYPVSWGEELAKRELERSEIYWEDNFLKSDGLSDIDSTLKTRVFSTNYSEDVEAIENFTRKDVSYIITHDDKTMYRYTTPSVTESTNYTSQEQFQKAPASTTLATYASADSSYYIVQIHSIVTTSRIAVSANDTEEEKDEKRHLAMQAAYEMASQDTYRKAAITFYLTENDIDYSDPDFYEYIQTNYPDAIKD